MPLTIDEETEYLELLEQEDSERVSPKMETVRSTTLPIVAVRGGRGAGAKSWSAVSLAVQEAHYEVHRYVCLREVQLTLQESLWQLIVDTINRLGYSGWEIGKERITSPTGSYFIFRGLRDMKAAGQLKGLEGFDRAICDEANAIMEDSWSMLVPTLARNEGFRLFILYNPETEYDPCTVRFWNADRDDVLRIEMLPGKADNPWWNDGLQKDMETLYRINPDEAEHVYGGQPRKQGHDCVHSRVEVRAAMNRSIEAVGGLEVGIDPAWMGNDETTIYRRRGLVCSDKDWRSFIGQDPVKTAKIAWEMGDRRPDTSFKVDGSPSGWATMIELKRLGASKVYQVNFGGVPNDKTKYTTIADEMWFTFPVDQAQIPNDNELLIELTGRKYGYTNDSRTKIEAKDEYKKRFGRSPDRADGLLLCFYRGGTILFDDETRKQMAARRARGR
jgi:phage terminase large subunit